MSNQNSYSPDSRPRRGNRRSGPRRNSNYSNYSRDRKSTPPAKPNFWQKFLAIFGIGKSKSKSQNGSKHPAYKAVRTERAERLDAPPREARKPELIDVTSPKIYVGNLSFDATESDLAELFNGVGQVQSAEIISHRHTQKSKGFAFVTMQSVEEAKRAVEVLHDKDFMGRKLVVSGAKTSDVRNAA